MSSDAIQRAPGDLAQTFFRYIVGFFSTSFLTTLIQYYLNVKEGAVRAWNQTCYTTNAVKCSFQTQYIRFYKVGDSFVPIHVFMGDVPHMMPGELQWIYDCSNKIFTEINSATREVRKVPYIAATLTNESGSETYADLSEWLVDVHTHSTDAFVPAQVLVGAFAFDTQTMLMRDLHQLYLRCMMLSLDEIIYNVGTGKDLDTPIQEVPSDSETEIQSASASLNKKRS